MVVKRVRVLLKGKVQGVFFRDFAKQNANKLGIVGYVKNLRSGDLEIVVQGEERNIDQYVKFCRSGPIFAKVGSVSIDLVHIEDESEYEFFDIRPD